MKPTAVDRAQARAVIFKVTAWVCWIMFLLVCLGETIFAYALKNDRYAVAYYLHNPMSQFTALMTGYPVWIALLPLVWLAFVVRYQRQPNPKGILLVPLTGSMLVTPLVIFILLLCSGPPIQM